MTATPAISIITPSFNQGAYIERTIQSVLSQGVTAIDYVVMDGGSSDTTVSILKRYEGSLRWESARDRGQSHAINKGFRATSGPVVGWLNSDDVYYPRALTKVLDFFADHPEVDVVYGDADHIDEHDRYIEPYPTEPWSFERLKELCFIPQPATFLRRAVVDEHGGLDEGLRYSMDYDYWFRLARRGVRFAHLAEPLAATRLHPDAATLAQRVACHAESNTVTRRHLGRTPDRWLLNYAHAVLEQDARRPLPRPLATWALAVVAIRAALRWNRAVTATMLVRLAAWSAADTYGSTARLVKRRVPYASTLTLGRHRH